VLDDKLEYFSGWAVKPQATQGRLLSLVDEDTARFQQSNGCIGLPKESPEEKATRAATIEEATKHAQDSPESHGNGIEVVCLAGEMAEKEEIPVSISDVGVGYPSYSPVHRGAAMNVRINLGH